MKLAILIADSNSACPVPAAKGGAVATLVEHIAELNNVDAIVFTGGVLENNADEIEMTVSNMENLGIIVVRY